MTKAATSYIALKALQAQAAVAASQREGLQTLLDTRRATPRLNFCFPRFDFDFPKDLSTPLCGVNKVNAAASMVALFYSNRVVSLRQQRAIGGSVATSSM